MVAPDTMAQLLDFVKRIAESESSLWILTREAKVTKRQAKDIVELLKARSTPEKFHHYPDTCSRIDGHSGECDGEDNHGDMT